MSYTPLLRRIRENKTNYRKRKAVLIGKHNFAAVRVSNQNAQIQILRATKRGDETLISAHSKELLKHEWKGSRKSIPACYLLGLLAGKKALEKNVKECILYAGDRIFSPRIAASVKGLLDAGMNIPVEEETLPEEDKLSGKRIADYAKELKENDSKLYKSRFSALVKDGFLPENYTEYVAKIKSSILGKEVKTEVKKVKPEIKVETEAPKKEKKAKETKGEKTVKKTPAKKESKGKKGGK